MTKPKIDMAQATAVLELIHPEYFAVRQEITLHNDFGNENRDRVEKYEMYSSKLRRSDTDTEGLWLEANSWEEVIKMYLTILKEQK